MVAATAGTMTVTIAAADRITQPLRRISESMSRVTGNMERMGQRLHRGLALDKITASARRTTRALEAMVPVLGTLTAAGTLVGLARLTSGFASMGAQLGRDAYRFRTSVDNLHALQGAARLAGSSAEDLTAGMHGLGTALVDAVGGRNREALMYLEGVLGISTRDADGNARTAADTIHEVADAISRIAETDPRLAERVMGALQIPPSLLPLLRRGSEGMRELEREARRLGGVTVAGAEAARRFEEAQSRLGLAFSGVGNVIAERVAPVLTPMLNNLATWVSEKGPGIASWLEGIARRFDAWVTDGGLRRLGENLDAVFTGIGRVVEAFGGWEVAATALGVVLAAKVLAPLVGITAALSRIGAVRIPPWVARMLPLAAVGAAGGEDRAFSEERNREWLRDNPRRDGSPSAPYEANGPVINRMLGNWARMMERAFSPRGGDRAVYGRAPLRLGPPGPEPTGLLGLIGAAEGTDRGRGYDESLGYGAFTGGPQNLTGMTLDEIDALQGRMLAHPGNTWRSSALGRYQITRTTLRELRSGLGLDGSTRFDEGLQDRLATALAERRGLRDFEAGRISSAEFQRRLAQEWASIPDPSTGQGFYANQRRPGIGQGAVDRVLGGLRGGQQVSPGPAAAPEGSGSQRVDVRLRFEGNVPPGLTATTRTADGGVRVERPLLGAAP